MKGWLILFVILIFYKVLAINPSDYCYNFTWIRKDNPGTQENCTNFKTVPCVDPIYYNVNTPNWTDLWENHNDFQYFGSTCHLEPGKVCVKYTYIYNNAILNVTYYCGKVIDMTQTKAVESDCASQIKDGHVIEVCACKSSNGDLPCNASPKILSSELIVLSAMLIFNYNI